jgi:hypothetical protein
MKHKFFFIVFNILSIFIQAQILPGFKPSGSFNEQQILIVNSPPGTRILINAPLKGFGKDDKVLLIFYALPNGNTIEQTFGKKLKYTEDWHFDIQHIGAQTRFLRNILEDQTVVVAYLEAVQKSWPLWVAETPESIQKIRKIVDEVTEMFVKWDPQVVLNGFIHSILSGTKYENKSYFYFGERAYSSLITDSVIIPIRRLNIPPQDPAAETGSVFMRRITALPLNEREEEIYKAIVSGNIPDFLRNTVTLNGEFADSAGITHLVTYEVMPDYLSIGNDTDFCRIPMNPNTAQSLAFEFGASLITARISDYIYLKADIKIAPFNYFPVGNANELVTKFVEHNTQIEKQLREAGGLHGRLIAGIKKDVILSGRIANQPGKVVIYGWHKPDGKPIQPVYSGHVYWYVDYSHGIRFINNQVLIDGKTCLFTEILKDPVLYKIFSDEDEPMRQVTYIKQ